MTFKKEILDLEDELEKREKESPIRLGYDDCWSLFRFLEHGSREHREWLAEAILAWSLGKPKPKERK